MGRYIEEVYKDNATRQMLEYVRDRLKPVDDAAKSGKRFSFRSRFEHTKRVLEWALTINEKECADAGILVVATIFHDVGYCEYREGGDGHSKISERIFREYIGMLPADILSANLTAQQIAEVSAVILAHSDKKLDCSLLTKEQMVLMDADLLDEAGAMRVLWECFMEAGKSQYDYVSAYKEIVKSYYELADDFAHLHTEEGKRLHLEMQDYIRRFVEGLRTELGQ